MRQSNHIYQVHSERRSPFPVLAIGTVTPPVALNLYVAANLADISIERISRASFPFVLALITALLVISYIPALSLYLPRLF